MRRFRSSLATVLATCCVAAACSGCAPSEQQLPARSGCGSAAIACYDEYANRSAGLTNYRPTSRWQRTNLTWRLVNPLPQLDVQQQIDAVERALALWAAVSKLRFQRADADADITISFESGAHGDPFPFLGDGSVLAHAFFPGSQRPGDVHLCADENWALAAAAGQFDLFTVALHETGHALGLEHSQVEGAVMAAGYPAGGLTALAQDDIRAVQALYGSEDGRRPPLAAPRPGQFGTPPDLLTQGDPDTDGDGVPDPMEVFVFGTDPFEADTDGDGTNDYTEIFVAGTPADVDRMGEVDTDDDGVPDKLEREKGTDPNRKDTDGDGLSDEEELFFYGTDALDPDSDDDGVLDAVEVFTADTDPFNADSDFDGVADGADGNPLEPRDSDDDSLPDGAEANFHGTDPNNPDTDGDGITDGDEVIFLGTDPLVPDEFNESAFTDSDDDGLPDVVETLEFGTHPENPDTDGDGLLDGDEVFEFTDPLKADTDGDGVSDRAEIKNFDTDPNDRDSDGDGVWDGKEIHDFFTDPNDPDTDGDDVPDGDELIVYHTDPLLADTDGDGVPDGEEILAGTNPLASATTALHSTTSSG